MEHTSIEMGAGLHTCPDAESQYEADEMLAAGRQCGAGFSEHFKQVSRVIIAVLRR